MTLKRLASSVYFLGAMFAVNADLSNYTVKDYGPDLEVTASGELYMDDFLKSWGTYYQASAAPFTFNIRFYYVELEQDDDAITRINIAIYRTRNRRLFYTAGFRNEEIFLTTVTVPVPQPWPQKESTDFQIYADDQIRVLIASKEREKNIIPEEYRKDYDGRRHFVIQYFKTINGEYYRQRVQLCTRKTCDRDFSSRYVGFNWDLYNPNNAAIEGDKPFDRSPWENISPKAQEKQKELNTYWEGVEEPKFDEDFSMIVVNGAKKPPSDVCLFFIAAINFTQATDSTENETVGCFSPMDSGGEGFPYKQFYRVPLLREELQDPYPDENPTRAYYRQLSSPGYAGFCWLGKGDSGEPTLSICENSRDHRKIEILKTGGEEKSLTGTIYALEKEASDLKIENSKWLHGLIGAAAVDLLLLAILLCSCCCSSNSRSAEGGYEMGRVVNT